MSLHFSSQPLSYGHLSQRRNSGGCKSNVDALLLLLKDLSHISLCFLRYTYGTTLRKQVYSNKSRVYSHVVYC